MFDIGKEILAEKFLNQNQNQNQNLNNFKKSGIFTGLRSSLTYQKNNINHQSKASNDYLYMNNNTKKKINEAIEILESMNQNGSSLTYKRNLVSPTGTKQSAVPHGVMQQSINKEAAPKPLHGKVPTMLNTVWGQKEIQKKYRNSARIFKNLHQF